MAYKKNYTKEDKIEDNKKKEEKIHDLINSYLDNSIETGNFANEKWTISNLDPTSIATGKCYEGHNMLILTQRIIRENWEDNRFITSQKLSYINYERKKENKEKLLPQKNDYATPIKFVSFSDKIDYYEEELKNEKNEEKKETLKKKINALKEYEEQTGKRQQFVNIGYRSMFNLSQLPEEIFELYPKEKAETNKELGSEPHLNYLIDAIIKTSEVPIVELKLAYETAFRGDKITMPPRENFINDRNYLAVLVHEVGHSLKEKDEKVNVKQKYKLNETQNYAVEELKAEMTSGITLVKLGIDIKSDDPEKNIFGANKNYIKHYAESLKKHEKIDKIFEDVAESAIERSKKILDKIKEYEKTYSFENYKENYTNKDIKEEIKVEDKAKETEMLYNISKNTVKSVIRESLENIEIRFERIDNKLDDLKDIDLLTRGIIDTNREAMQNVSLGNIKTEINHLDEKKNVIGKYDEPMFILSDDSISKLDKTIKSYGKMLSDSQPIFVIPENDLEEYKNAEISKEIKKILRKGETPNEQELLKRTNDEYLEKYKEVFKEKFIELVSITATESISFEKAHEEVNSIGEICFESFEQVKFEYSPNELITSRIANNMSFILKDIQEYENRKEYNDEIGLDVTDEIYSKKTILKALDMEDNMIETYLKNDDINFKMLVKGLDMQRLEDEKDRNFAKTNLTENREIEEVKMPDKKSKEVKEKEMEL
jgi:hypothetical protein